MKIENRSPYEADYCVVADEEGFDLFVCCIKATFQAPSKSKATRLEKQIPVSWQDVYYDDPATSSLQFASDLMPFVFGTDIILHGFAYPDKPHATSVHVGLQVAGVQKIVTALGYRQWQKIGTVHTISAPKPFQKIPLQYEYAFGGKDESNAKIEKNGLEPRNPVGMGYRSSHSILPTDGQALPYLESPAKRISSPSDKPEPAGFGFIAPHWLPRVAFGGTYDALWQNTRMPLLPTDFDRRFFQVASSGLTTPKPLTGNEAVQVVNATPNGDWQFRLPVVRLKVLIRFKQKPEKSLEVALGRVLLDGETQTVTMCWYGSLRIPDVHQLKTLEVDAI
jgi:hypothetical protein